MAAGYVYVLANSSMPGLVKVGKTTRLPSERADELSGVTGVATPFIVVFEEYFEDCDAVEMYVHTALSAKGLRLSESREFFRAAVSDVVKALISVKATQATLPTNGAEFAGLLTPNGSELEGFRLYYRNPWHDLMIEADKHYYGRDGYIQDYVEACKLYRDAARLGSPEAFDRLGRMYHYGEGVSQDKQRALELYKEGTKKGSYFCWAGMAQLFIETGHLENARKALSKFIAGGEADGWRNSHRDLHIALMRWILVPPLSTVTADTELLSIASVYLSQIRESLRVDLEPGGLAATYPLLRTPLASLLNSIESLMR